MKNLATSDLLMASRDIISTPLIKTEDVETRRYFSVNDELDKLDYFDRSTPDVTTMVGK